MANIESGYLGFTPLYAGSAAGPAKASRFFSAAKRATDVVISVLALPVVVAVAGALLVLNLFFNSGPLFYVQHRMGRDLKPFRMLKFRSMTVAALTARGAEDPLEVERITPLGYYLRRSRMDELPQFFNVLLGQMSVIGPRPDSWDHAVKYAELIPDYASRYSVRPGITGLAQVCGGYAEGLRETERKTHYDVTYIRNRCFSLELYVLWRTAVVLATGFGSR